MAAIAMSKRIGQTFDGIVTGVTEHGTFVRVLNPSVEGLLDQAHGLDVGDRIKVKLVRTDVQRGYIDFARA
jgi:exoribonuclease-2